jgi:membrane-bound metal-dependent hydrolase YbcI (DUF457 family)
VTDLLTHVLVAWVVGLVAARRGWLPRRYVSVAMVGAAAPDAMKLTVQLGVHRGTVAGLPYSTWGYHTLGGVLVVAGLGALTIRAADRRGAFLALSAGGASHLLLDALVIRADGLSPPYLFPFSTWLPPAGNVYLSSDAWPVAVAIVVAAAAWLYDARVGE